MGLFKDLKDAFTSDGSGENVWHTIKERDEVESVIQASFQKPQLVYKHSHRCGTCLFAKSDLESEAEALEEKADLNFVNVISQRKVSNTLAQITGIDHESPQVLVLDDGSVRWHGSHGKVSATNILQALDG